MVLLGFVKYFWRDAVARVSVANKAILTLRISSLNTSGLGLPRLSGKTYVQYAGSLVGRDFRYIVQVVPFVLHGLVDTRIYEAWLSLSCVARLAWQPEIHDIVKYKVVATV